MRRVVACVLGCADAHGVAGQAFDASPQTSAVEMRFLSDRVVHGRMESAEDEYGRGARVINRPSALLQQPGEMRNERIVDQAVTGRMRW